jgi:hypothetical protein
MILLAHAELEGLICSGPVAGGEHTFTDVRAGLQQARDQLDSFQHDGRTFWHAPGQAPAGPQEPAGRLLQILDETYRGYQDSRWLLDTVGDVPRTRETATGMALVDAQLLAPCGAPSPTATFSSSCGPTGP